MSTTSTSSTSTKQLLRAIDQIDIEELRPFVSEILARAAQRWAPRLPSEESSLVQEINRGLPADVEQRSRELDAKRCAGTLTDAEYEELLQLVDQIEVVQAERMRNLIALAELRGQPLPSLLDDLGLDSPAVG